MHPELAMYSYQEVIPSTNRQLLIASCPDGDVGCRQRESALLMLTYKGTIRVSEIVPTVLPAGIEPATTGV